MKNILVTEDKDPYDTNTFDKHIVVEDVELTRTLILKFMGEPLVIAASKSILNQCFNIELDNGKYLQKGATYLACCDNDNAVTVLKGINSQHENMENS